MGRPLERYEPSGRFRGWALIAGPLAGLLVALPIAWVYQTIISRYPLPNGTTLYSIFVFSVAGLVLLAAGFGAAIAGGVRWGLRRAHCRNPLLAVVIALLCAAAGDLAGFKWLQNREAEVVPWINDLSVLSFIESQRHQERLAVEGFPIINSVLWSVEFLVIAGMAGYVARLGVTKPYCESCGSWTIKGLDVAIPNIRSSALEAAVERGDLPALLDPPQNPASSYSGIYSIWQCPECSSGFLSITARGDKSHSLVRYTPVPPGELATFPTRAETLGAQVELAPGLPLDMEPDSADRDGDGSEL